MFHAVSSYFQILVVLFFTTRYQKFVGKARHDTMLPSILVFRLLICSPLAPVVQPSHSWFGKKLLFSKVAVAASRPHGHAHGGGGERSRICVNEDKNDKTRMAMGIKTGHSSSRAARNFEGSSSQG